MTKKYECIFLKLMQKLECEWQESVFSRYLCLSSLWTATGDQRQGRKGGMERATKQAARKSGLLVAAVLYNTMAVD